MASSDGGLRRSGMGRGSLFVLTAAAIVLAAGSAGAQVVLNEVLASNRFTNTDEDGDASDWVELYNTGPAAVELEGYALSDDPLLPRKWLFPEASLGPGAYLLVWCSGKDRRAIAPERITEPNSPLPFVPALISLEDAWSYLVGAPDAPGPAAEWKSPDFDDSGWKRGRPGFGFGAGEEFGTPLPPGTGAVFLRRRFHFEPGLKNLVLQVRYDDGFVAYLNGARVASGRFPEGEEPTFASRASGSHSPRVVERFDLTSRLDLLRPGENLLAMVLLNITPANNDLVLFPELGFVPPVLHTSFKIDAGGETVLLADPRGAARDSVVLPPQATDHSFARSPDGRGPFLYHRTPTPLAMNDGPASEAPLLVADTKFSVDRGFHDGPFEVEISTATPGAEIRYTLDGTLPGEANGALYERPIAIERTTTLRARAFKPGFEPANADTQTYIFLDDVIRQDQASAIAAGFPRTWGGTAADYGFDRRVIGPGDGFGGIYAATIRDDLRSLPSLSIVLETDDLFGPAGIYTNSQQGGAAWERPASVELIYPDGRRGFQVDCGLRIQGGYFRQHAATRKHSLRLLFKRKYGPAKLRFPWFGEEAVDAFDTIVLRAGANDGYSWSAARLTEQYTRDEFGRGLQGATGNAASRGAFVHLYLNGLYWGLYNPAERPDHSFSAGRYGGDKEDWDALHDGAPTNGDTAAWTAMLRQCAAARTSLAAYQELQGRNPDGSRNPEFPHLLDVPNYADYLIVNLWGGNWDWPWKNWWAGRERSARSTGFKFYSWDYENTMGNNRERSPLEKNALQNNFSSAGEPHQSLRLSPEYRLHFADRIHRLFFGGGVLTPQSLIPRYAALAAQVERAIVAESARWGDQHHNPPLTLREWTAERDWILGAYLPQRSEIVLGQFRAAGLYPAVAAPVFNHEGGLVEAGFTLVPIAPAGVIYFTVEGGDPRLPGGDVNPAAFAAPGGDKVVLVPEDAALRLHVPAGGELGLQWTLPEFDDAGWLEGRLAVGYETATGYEELIATDLRDLLHGVNSSVYLRLPFVVEEPSSLAFLTLRMRYDDGFVAYLNGRRVASRNARDPAAWNSTSTVSRPDRLAIMFEDIPLAGDLLLPGRNLLAIHGLNFRASDDDFLIQAELAAVSAAGAGLRLERSAVARARALVDGAWSALQEAAFVIDSGIPLRITEIMYHPPPPPAGSRYDADDFEFLELFNAGSRPLDLSAVRLRGGVSFDFAASEVDVLQPGEHVVLVENPAAFRTRPDAAAVKVAGRYTGKLSNSGEALILEGYLGEPILAFAYQDDWYPETDGRGRSLVIADPYLPRESWGRKSSWRASRAPGGSPGRADDEPVPAGRQRPGDISQDGRLNITDAVLLLRHLFAGAPAALPCGGGSISTGGNAALYDFDGDGAVRATDAIAILQHLFARGAPAALGSGCVPIAGCAEACRG